MSKCVEMDYLRHHIGRASYRERLKISVGAVSLNKKVLGGGGVWWQLVCVKDDISPRGPLPSAVTRPGPFALVCVVCTTKSLRALCVCGPAFVVI